MWFPSLVDILYWPIQKAHIVSWWAISVVFSVLCVLRSRGTLDWSWWSIFLPTILFGKFSFCLSLLTCRYWHMTVDFAALLWYRPRSIVLNIATFAFLNFFCFQLPWALSLSSDQGSDFFKHALHNYRWHWQAGISAMSGPISYTFPSRNNQAQLAAHQIRSDMFSFSGVVLSVFPDRRFEWDDIRHEVY